MRVPFTELALLLYSCLASTAEAVTVTVDVSREYQTIDGFGSWGMRVPPWGADTRDTVPVLWNDDFVDMIMYDMGLTIIRDELPSWEFEAVNDNDDPFNTDFSKFNLTGNDRMAKQLAWLRRLKREGIDKVLVCVWSPAPWMKDNNAIGGGHLLSSMLNEFAEMCWAYIQVLKEECAVDVYALGVQNEPELAMGYASCNADPQQMADRVSAVKAYFRSKGCATKVLGPEKIWEPSAIGTFGLSDYLTEIYDRPTGADDLDIIGVHYPGGDSMDYDFHVADPSWLYPNHQWTWIDTGWGWSKTGKQFWVTEGGGFGDSWDGAMQLAKCLHNGFTWGHMTAWIWWSLGDALGADREYALSWDGVPGYCYRVSKLFYRYIRPGAVMVDCQSTDVKHVGALAFTHREMNYTTVQLVNASPSTQEVTIQGAGLPVDFDAFRATAAVAFEQLPGKVTRDVSLPPQSVTTLCSKVPLIGGGTSVAPAERGNRPAAAVSQPWSTRRYDLCGRLVPRAALAGPRAAVSVTGPGELRVTPLPERQRRRTR